MLRQLSYCAQQVDAALGAACDYRARLSMECCNLDLSVSAGPKGDVEGTLRLWRLEAVEHIPAAAGAAAASATALEEVRCLHVSYLNLPDTFSIKVFRWLGRI